jgi:hypothetical protein
MLLEAESGISAQRSVEIYPTPARRSGLWSRLIGERT